MHQPTVQETVLNRIDRFNNEVVLPAFEEMKATLVQHGKTVSIFPGAPTGNRMLAEIFQIMHPETPLLAQLARQFPAHVQIKRGEARYIGYSFIVEEPPTPGAHPDAEKFFLSIELLLGEVGRVYASPIVMYYMRFNGKFHKFAQRFKQAIEFQSIDEISKYDIQNHFLDAFNFYQIHANSSERPW